MNTPSNNTQQGAEIHAAIITYSGNKFLVEFRYDQHMMLVNWNGKSVPLVSALAKLGFKREVKEGKLIGYSTIDPMVAAAAENGAWFLLLDDKASAALRSQEHLVEMSHTIDGKVDLSPNNEGLVLRNYQAAGVNFIRNTWARGVGVLNVDDVGLGKTAQALVATMLESKGRVLVVCPANVRYNWLKEIKRWWSCEGSPIAKTSPFTPTGWIADMSQVEVLEGYKAPRKDAKVVVVGYSNFSRTDAAGKIFSQEWDVIILDEAHYIKNMDSTRSKMVRKLTGRRRIAITATPMEKAEDIFPQLQFLDPGTYATYADFLNAFGTNNQAPQAINDSVRGRMMIGRKKSEVATDLPPLMIDVRFIEPSASMKIHPAIKNHASTMERLLADAVVRWEHMALQGPSSHDTIRKEFNVLMSRSGKISGLSPEDIVEQRKAAAFDKMEFVVEQALQMVATGDQVVIGYHHKVVGDKLQELLGKELGDEQVSRIDGSVSSKDRELIRETLDRKEIKIILASITAASTGINLQAANNIVMAEIDWSGANNSQFYGRIHRIGQQNNCFVLVPVLSGTIEQHIMSIQGWKSVILDIIKD